MRTRYLPGDSYRLLVLCQKEKACGLRISSNSLPRPATAAIAITRVQILLQKSGSHWRAT